MEASELNRAVGRRITELRHARNLSLSRLARLAGIGKGSLSELEAGTRNPTLATLYALAGPLEVPLSTLLIDRVGTEVSADGFFGQLLDVRTGHTMIRETFRFDLAAGAQRISPAHGPGVIEHLLVTEGVVLAGPLGAEQRCPAGTSIHWVSDTAHSYQAPDGPASNILVILTPHGQ